MTTADPDSANVQDVSGETVFSVLVRQMGNPRLRRQRWDQVVGDLSLLDIVTINKIQEDILKVAAEVLQDNFATALVRQVLNQDYLAQLRSLIPKEIEKLRQLVFDWHDYLDETSSFSAIANHAQPYILAAFSLVEDYTLYLAQDALDKLVQDIAARERSTKEEALVQARKRADAGKNRDGGRLDKEIWDGIDILALIIVLMNRSGLKPVVQDEGLQDWLIDYYTRELFPAAGGAAANETFILREMGIPVIVHTPYHHSQQAGCAPRQACRLLFDEKGPCRPYPLLNEGQSEDARRYGLILQLTPITDAQGKRSPVLRIGTEEIRPKSPDRVILRIPNPRNDTLPSWNTLRVTWRSRETDLPHIDIANDPTTLRWEGKTGHWVAEIARDAVFAKRSNPGTRTEQVFRGFKASDWPFLPVFQHRACVDSEGVLVIELASAAELSAIAEDVQVVLLGGIQALGQTLLTDTLTHFLRVVLVSQLRALAAPATSLHFELSAVSSGKVLDELQPIFKDGGIRHISINREELVQITSEHGSRYFTWPQPSAPESAMGIFLRARNFLLALDVDTCYVHDAELDIFVAKRVPGLSLDRHRQAMLLAKAAVPEGLLRRSGAPQPWPLILSSPSFATLLAFAREYAELTTGCYRDLDKQEVEEQIVRYGFYHPPAPKDGADSDKDVAVVVAPAIYVELGDKVNMTGAGDMCFAVHAVFSRSDLQTRSS